MDRGQPHASGFLDPRLYQLIFELGSARRYAAILLAILMLVSFWILRVVLGAGGLPRSGAALNPAMLGLWHGCISRSGIYVGWTLVLVMGATSPWRMLESVLAGLMGAAH
jgi:hypothetical protein